MLIDTHCHLDFPEFDPDRDEVIKKASSCGVTQIVNVGSSIQGSEGSVKLSRKYENVFACVGIHPHEADSFKDEQIDILRRLAKEEKVVAIGEIGLDYFKNYSQAENQRLLFNSLLRLSRELSLPVVVHTRNAFLDTLKMLREWMPLKVIVHCFSGDENFLKECLELGFFISFACNITYKKAEGLRQMVKITPLERLMLETDAPYLSPEGFRGKRNDPSFVRFLAQEVANIKGTEFEKVAEISTANAKEFFKLP